MYTPTPIWTPMCTDSGAILTSMGIGGCARSLTLADSRWKEEVMAAERQTKDRLMSAWLSDQVGGVFRGRIAGVTRSGLFVKLDGSGADGFIPASTLLGDYYVHDETAQALVGERSGETFRLGDKADVRLIEVTPLAGGLRFELLSEGRKGKPKKRNTRKKTHYRGKKRR